MNISEMISQVLGRASDHIPFDDPEVQHAVRVLARVQMHLYGSWKRAQQMGIACQQRMRSQRGEMRCVEPMAGTCVACRKPVCLHHSAAVVDSGDLICFGCIGNAQQVAQTQEGRASAASSDSYERQGQGAQPPQPAADEEKLRKKYLKRLKLQGEPTEDEIRAAFKREAAKAHPDVAPADKKQKAHERFVALGEARDWLLAHGKKKAAA